MVELGRLIVNDYQIRVNVVFLNLQVIAIGKCGDNTFNISFIRFRKWDFNRSIFDIAQGVSGMNSGNIIPIYDITVVNSSKRC